MAGGGHSGGGGHGVRVHTASTANHGDKIINNILKPALALPLRTQNAPVTNYELPVTRHFVSFPAVVAAPAASAVAAPTRTTSAVSVRFGDARPG